MKLPVVLSVLVLFPFAPISAQDPNRFQPPPQIAIDDAMKASAAIETLKNYLEQMLNSQNDLDPETRRQIAEALAQSEGSAEELSKLVYEIVRSFRGERVLGAISWGIGGEKTWKLPFLKGIGAGLGGEVSGGLALVFKRNQGVTWENPEVTGYYSYGPHLATGFRKQPDSLMRTRGGRQIFPIFRLYFVPAREDVVLSHSGSLSRWYGGFAFEFPWKLLVKGTFQAQFYGSWGMIRERTTEEVKRASVPEVIMLALAPGVGAQNSGVSLQVEGQYVQFVGLQNK